MTFELLVIRKDWFLTRNSKSNDFVGLTKIINKSYSKFRYKFDIIKTQRVKDSKTFIEDFSIDNDSVFCLFILLGPTNVFAEIREKDNFDRDFDIPNRSLSESYACDIPEKYYDLLHFDNASDIEINEADINFVFDDTILKRVLGTVGLKTHSTGMPVDLETGELLLTCFTSFMRNTAPILLDKVIYKYLLDSNLMSSHQFFNTKTKKVILHADVIKEHRLVDYYSSKCGFEFVSEILIEVDDEGRPKNSPFEKDIFATRNFHISFMHREIHI